MHDAIGIVVHLLGEPGAHGHGGHPWKRVCAPLRRRRIAGVHEEVALAVEGYDRAVLNLRLAAIHEAKRPKAEVGGGVHVDRPAAARGGPPITLLFSWLAAPRAVFSVVLCS